MSQQLPVKQNESGATTRNIEKLMALSQKKFTRIFEGTQQKFDASMWEIGHLARRAKSEQAIRLHFAARGNNSDLFPTYFAEVVKCWLLFKKSSPEHMKTKLDAMKALWAAILIRRGNNRWRFTWDSLCEEDLRQAEHLMKKEWELTTYAARANLLVAFTRFLETHGICRTLYFVPSPNTYRHVRYNTMAGLDVRRSKLPTKRALEGLGEIYATHAKLPADRLCSAAIALFVVTGFRIGELLTLPAQCEVEENYKGKARYGLYYYREKTRSSYLVKDIKWLTPIQAELARVAVEEIRSITAPARERAKLLEKYDDRVYIPEFDSIAYVTARQITQTVGISIDTLYQLADKGVLLRQKGNSGRWLYSTYALERHLLWQRYRHLWTVNCGNGTYQWLSESLFVVPRLFFNPVCASSKYLVEPVMPQHIRSFIVPNGQGKSAFERFNIREEDGSFCRVTSHQFRHWLNDIADKGGLPIDVLTRWMGRENPRDTEAYRHATVDERLKWVKAGIKEEVITGTMAEVYFELSSEERDTFLDAQLQAVHFTPMGICVHDFAIEPCPYHLNCVRGCPHYLRTKGSQKEREHLIQIQENTEKALEAARQYAANTGAEVSQTWIRHHEETLKGVKDALSVDDDMNTPDGNLVKPVSIPLMVINSGSE